MDLSKLTNAESVTINTNGETERAAITLNDTASKNAVEEQGGKSVNTKKAGKSADAKGTGKSTGKGGKGGSNANGNGSNGNHAGSSSSVVNVPAPTFPLARVSRIVKADPDIQMTSKDAIWTIAVATELFIKHLTDSLISKTKLDKKKIASYKELSSVVETQEEFEFLQEVIPEPIQAQEAFQFRKELQEQNYQRAVGLLIDEDSDEEEEEEEEEEEAEAEAEAMDEQQADGITQQTAEDAEEQREVDGVIQDGQDVSKKGKKPGKSKSTTAKGKKPDGNVREVTDTTTNEKEAEDSPTKKSTKPNKGGRKSAIKVNESNDIDSEMRDL